MLPPTVESTAVSASRPPNFVPGYRLERLLGRGGMGEVYEAVQLSLGRKVAVKLLTPELAKDEQFVGRFEKEGAALAALNHPNIVSIVDKGRTESTYFLVMEYVDGGTLRERMRDPELDVASMLRMFAQVARAIEYAHQRGVVHRDIKPENILFDLQAGDLAKVTDFGLAGLDETLWSAANLTQTHVAMGTVHYMAPEQKTDARRADARADIYALGVVLYELLCGDVPQGTFTPPSQRRPGVDKRVDAIVARCLKPDPADRYRTVTELLADLDPLLPRQSLLSSPRLRPLDRAVLAARRLGRRLAVAAGAALVLWALGLIAASALRESAQARRPSPGVQLATDTGARFPLTTRGRLDRELESLSFGEGPDMLAVQALGRPVRVEGGLLVYDAPEGERAGRAVIDATLDAPGLSWSADAMPEEVTASALEPMLRVVRGPRPHARAALLLAGEPGRYVALVVSSAPEDPPMLEWSLGPGRQGTMTAPLPAAVGPRSLELRVDPERGELSAWVGKDRDRRLLGDPLGLGEDWRRLFGAPVRPAVGCLEGRCRFAGLALRGLAPPAPPLPPPAPLVQAPPPEPTPEPARDVKKAPARAPATKKTLRRR